MTDSADRARQDTVEKMIDGKDRAKPLHTTLELALVVRDPEVVAQLLRVEEGEERTQYALGALRVGVLSMRMAGGQVDAAAIRESGKELLSQIRDLLTERALEMTGTVSSSLKQYFDPSSGVFQQRIDSLVKKDGELERVLREQLGPEDSTMAKSLAQYLGENSPVLKMLSPSDSEGIRAQLEAVTRQALEEQREKVVGQFSLDNENSALSRLLAEIGRKQGNLGEDLKGQIQALTEQFSSDSEGSALNRLSQLLKQADERIGRNLTLDREDSPLSVLKRSLEETLGSFERSNSEFQKDVRDTLAEYRIRKDEAAKSTRHGLEFEEQLGRLIAEEASRLGDVFEPTGNTTGIIKNCKIGDHVVRLGAETATPGAIIVWEAKERERVSITEALEEMEKGRKNREAQVGIFVYSQKVAPEPLEPITRYGNSIVVSWNAEDPSTDLYVKAAYSLARAMTVRESTDNADSAQIVREIDVAARAIEKQVGNLGQVKTWSDTIKNNADNISKRMILMKEDLENQLESLDRQTDRLKNEKD